MYERIVFIRKCGNGILYTHLQPEINCMGYSGQHNARKCVKLNQIKCIINQSNRITINATGKLHYLATIFWVFGYVTFTFSKQTQVARFMRISK